MSDPVATTCADEPPIPRRSHQRPSRIFRRTTMRRAIIEGTAIFVVGRMLAMVPAHIWPAPVFPLVLVVRLILSFSPPVWAAMRVISTRREKMSRRFWRLGPLLAIFCTLADAAIALTIGEFTLFGGPAGAPDLQRLMNGELAIGGFLTGEVVTLAILLIYYTIAVVCTRLANGGFLRFTMPAGGGRVTL